MTTEDHIRLGDWELEPARNVLRRDAQEVALEPRAMDVLVHLAANAGRTVSPDELLDAFWEGRYVESSTVHKVVNKIRRALGDSPKRATYIETVPKRGYRVVAPVTHPGRPQLTQATEIVTRMGPLATLSEPAGTLGLGRFALHGSVYQLGRSRDNDCVLRDPSVSKVHARIARHGAGWMVTDLDSSNGVYVNDERVDSRELCDRDRLTLGRIELLVEIVA